MTDLAMVWNNQTGTGDLALTPDGRDLVQEGGLRTAIIISLATDARALADDKLPPDGRRGGFWADSLRLDGAAADTTGSRLWLLENEKQVQRVLVRARAMAEQALKWLVDDGVAQTVAVVTSFPALGQLLIAVTLNRGTASQQQFDIIWTAEGLR